MGRVNAFLKILKSGKPNNSRYVTDNDLLPADHPWRKKTQSKGVKRVIFREVSRLQEIPQNEIKEMVRVHNRQMTRSGSPEWTKTDSKSLSEVWRRATARKADPAVEAQAFLGNLEGKDGRRKYNFVNADLMPEDHPWLQNSKAAMFERLTQFKVARTRKPKLTTVGAIGAVRDGLAIVDNLGALRCPPGTPGAMQFTNSRGEGCEVPSRNFLQPIERIAQTDLSQIEPEYVYNAARIAQTRLGKDKTPNVARRTIIAENLRKKPKDSPASIESVVQSATGEGFSLDLVTGKEPSSGFVVARKGRGIVIPVDEYMDDKGNVKPEATEAVLRFIAANADELASGPVDGAESVVIGGWQAVIKDKDGRIVRNPDGTEKKGIFLDISDIFPKGDPGKEDEAKALAEKIGRERNQQAIFDLDALDEIQTGGTGADVLPEEEIERASGQGRARKISSTPTQIEKDPLVNLFKAIEGKDNMNLDNFSDKEVEVMMEKLQAVPGYQWIDPKNPSHLLLAIEQGATNLTELMGRASDKDIAKSRRWYDIANEYANVLAKEYGVSEATASAVLAALSPTADWRNNVVTARHVLALYKSKEALPDEFAEDLLASLTAAYQVRNGKTAKSWDGKIKQAEKELKELTSELAKAKEKKQINSIKTKIAGRKKNIIKYQNAQKADRLYSLEELKGKNLSELPIETQAIAVALHAQTLGGAFLGQGGTVKNEKGKSPDAIRQEEFLFEEDFPDWDENRSWKLSVRSNKDGSARRGMIQSEPNYESALEMIRADQDGKPDWNAIGESIGKGSKVRSFFNNIYNPNDDKYADITGDTHFFGGATMVPVSAKHDILDVLFSSNATGAGLSYPIFRAMVVAATDRWNESKKDTLLPRQVQSITWEAIRALVPDEDTSLKGSITNQMAQFVRLSSGPNPERPDLSGRSLEFLAELADAMQIPGASKDKLPALREAALVPLYNKWGLQPPKGIDILKVTEKKKSEE
jgi:hypothetical protein